MIMRLKTDNFNRDDRGFAALAIAIVLVLVLGLLTVGFAELMQKEQRSALDKHLNSQAYYAAETGVNDAAKAIIAGYPKAKTNCQPLTGADALLPGGNNLTRNAVGSDPNIAYTCLLINPTPDDLQYKAIPLNKSRAVLLTAVKGSDPAAQTTIKDLTITWVDTAREASARPGPDRNFKKSADWDFMGVLRVSLTPLTSNLSRESLQKSTYIAYLYPNAGGSASPNTDTYNSRTIGDNGQQAGAIVDGNCRPINPGDTEAKRCSVKITDIGQSNILLDMYSIYRENEVVITGVDDDGNRVKFKNAQTVIDVTGKAQDVLKRIQTRISNRNVYDYPDNGLETGGNICKQLQVLPSSATSECDPGT